MKQNTSVALLMQGINDLLQSGSIEQYIYRICMNDNELKLFKKYNNTNDMSNSLPKLAIITESTEAWGTKYVKLCKELRLQHLSLLQKNKSHFHEKHQKVNKCHAFVELLEKRRKYFLSGSKIPPQCKSSQKKNEANKFNQNHSLKKDRSLFNKNKSQENAEQHIIIVKTKISKQGNQNNTRYSNNDEILLQKNQILHKKYSKQQYSTNETEKFTKANLRPESIYRFLDQRQKKGNPCEKLLRIYPQSYAFKNQKETVLSPWEAEVPDFSVIQI